MITRLGFSLSLVLSVLLLNSSPVHSQRNPRGIYDIRDIPELEDNYRGDVCWRIPTYRGSRRRPRRIELIIFYDNVILGYYRNRRGRKIRIEERVIFRVNQAQKDLIFNIMDKKRTGIVKWKEIYWLDETDKHYMPQGRYRLVYIRGGDGCNCIEY
ncbi:MAG: hypothetical protein AAGF07_05330 [Patescibacteria group bacterium]